jgi:GH35 family endo-1,4-beta-xylanase
MTHTVYLPIVSNQQPSLKAAFARHGMQFGFAVASSSFRNKVTGAIIEQHASIVATENAMKMEYTQPQRGVYDFSEADKIVEHASGLGVDVHGHSASWANQNPAWLNSGNFSRNELANILKEHVSKLSIHYTDKIVSLDTANEGYVCGLNEGVWLPIGDDYIKYSFESCGYDHPLMYNSFFPANDEYDKAISLLNKGWASGIGIQLHLHYDGWETILTRTDRFLDRIRALGAWARFSEVGVLAPEPQQSAIYAAMTQLAIKHKDIVRGVIVWGVTDPAWRGDVTLFDSEGKPKPCYDAVADVLHK